MTYSAIQSARPVLQASRRGTAFFHALSLQHVFVTQYPLAWDKPELYSGEFQRSYEFLKTGRAMAGHLRYVGDTQTVVQWNGFLNINTGCAGGAVGDAQTELALFAQFLKGDVETAPYSEAYPYPLLQVGHGTTGAPTVGPGGIIYPFAPGSMPFAPSSQPFASTWEATDDNRAPYIVPAWFVYEADSLKFDKPQFDGQNYIPYSFSLRKLPDPSKTLLT